MGVAVVFVVALVVQNKNALIGDFLFQDAFFEGTYRNDTSPPPYPHEHGLPVTTGNNRDLLGFIKNWKLYINDSANFSMRMPEGYRIIKDSYYGLEGYGINDLEDGVEFYHGSGSGSGELQQTYLRISLLSSEDYSRILDKTSPYAGYFPKENCVPGNGSQSDVVVGGRVFDKFYCTFPDYGKGVAVMYIGKGENNRYVIYTMYKDSSSFAGAVVDGMLLSLKFN